jgi:excinuclease ABC subunit A
MKEVIRLRGVRVHNLKNVDVDIPVNSLTVITGPSGSGKSSLAFDTLYAEGRRRFVQSLSAYARQFLERIERPEADLIESIFPAIAIQQKNQVTGSRSTVGTITEVHDYLRLLYGRIGLVRCRSCHTIVRVETPDDVAIAVERAEPGTRIWICFHPPAPMDAGLLLKKGFVRVLAPGESPEAIRLEERPGRVEERMAVVVDRVVAAPDVRGRVVEAAETAFREGAGRMALRIGDQWRSFDATFRCSACDIAYPKPEPNLFSFNSAYGACPRCRGFGDVIDLDLDAVVPDHERSIANGAIEPWRRSTRARELNHLLKYCEKHEIPIDVPWKDLDEAQRSLVIDGDKRWGGVRGFFARLEKKKYKMHVRVFISRYRGYHRCPECRGTRLRSEANLVLVGKKSIGEVGAMPLVRVLEWLEELKLQPRQAAVAARLLDELKGRIGLLVRLGIGYLTLDRRAQTLSGGEMQRINLATALGGGLTGTLYVLDEPTVGLHERDTDRLIDILTSIRDLGNTVVVVEHDRRVIAAADWLIDLGPGAGREGGNVVYSGTQSAFLGNRTSITARYMSGDRSIPVVPVRRKRGSEAIRVGNARENNLKNLTVDFPLNCLCCVTGVSGSGKSSLVHDVLYANMMNQRGEWTRRVGACDGISGHERLKTIEMIDQGPIGRSPRSNPVTYLKAFAEIRALYAERYQARLRGYKPSDFSFNVRGGRCETCQGTGEIAIEMQFLPDVHIVCEDCNGKRYKREILDIRYKGLNIHDVLQLSVSEAVEHFRDYPVIVRKIGVLQEVGLGYLQLGQSATTLSGGEGQRVKLAAHLGRSDIGGSLFIFDEPTTGLHFSDVRMLLDALRRLVFHGASVIVIEHNPDVIKNADWIIDLGPEGGDKGGWVVATGTPEEVAERDGSWTGRYLREALRGSYAADSAHRRPAS